MLAPDVVLHGDGGGKAGAVGKPLGGRQRVMRLLVGLLRRTRILGVSLRLAWVNSQPGAVLYDAEGRVVSVVELDVADGVVRRSALWSTPASLVISDRCLMWRDCRPRRTPNSEPRSTVTQRTGIPSRTAAMRALSESRVGYAP
jgi:hypothetical protein